MRLLPIPRSYHEAPRDSFFAVNGARWATRAGWGYSPARLEDDNAVSFDIECPVDQGRITPNLAHVSWTAGIMSEMCGSFPLYLGVMAFAGTVTTRFLVPVAVGERLIGRATLDRRERRKSFVDATLTSSLTGSELATASGIAIGMRGA